MSVLYGRPPSAGRRLRAEVAGYMNVAGTCYDNPLFTLNAFAFTAEGDPDPVVQGFPTSCLR